MKKYPVNVMSIKEQETPAVRELIASDGTALNEIIVNA